MAPYLPLALPSRTVPLAARQASAASATVTVTVPSTPDHGSGGTTLTGGAIAGIVIGSIAGTLLLLWIIRSCFNLGGPSPTPDIEPWYGRHGEPKYHHRHHHHHRRPRSRQRSRSSSVTLPPAVVVKQERTRPGRQRSASRKVYNAY